MYWNNKFTYPKSSRSIFQGSRHYTINQENLPSVTTILKATESEGKKAKLEEWKKRVGYKQAEVISREATSRGSSMHDYLEKFLLGKLNLDLLGDNTRERMMAKIIVCNVDEETLAHGNEYTQMMREKYPNEKIINICADIEDQLSGLNKNEKESFMRDIGLYKTGINKLIKEGYDLLKLDTFFTSGPEESRAWTVKKNTIAPKAASVIHTDFEKNFIRAEAVSCEDFIKYGSAEKCKENGKLRIEGKDYIIKDGDVLYFRVNP
jgi:ribosome-binding ATPase YchF (GTP1/OBG family)